MRLYVLVEGQTEESFVKSMLAPHLASFELEVRAIIVESSRDAHGRKHKGGGHWAHWLRDLKRLTGEQDGRFTTMFDLYGLPRDFPGLRATASITDTSLRAEALETAMATAVGDWRLIPYLQRHEFEALVLCVLDQLAELLEAEDIAGLEKLRAAIGMAAPEDVNDGKETAPSKRLKNFIPGYRKNLHGPLTLEAGGLTILRKRCPRFGDWVARLEGLGDTT
jgi:hypothetical protein